MATGKVRIFELAKELGMSSKDLIGLFERLGLEAKNQLSLVEPPIAELVRGVLLGGAKAAKAAPAAAAPAAPAKTATAIAPKPVKAAAAPVAAEPVPSLKPVPATARRAASKPAAGAAVAAAAEPSASEPVAVAAVASEPAVPAAQSAPAEQPVAAAAAGVESPDAPAGPAPKPEVRTGSPKPRLAPPRPAGAATAPPTTAPPRAAAPPATPMPPRPRPPAAPVDNSPIPQLRPVPAGRSSIVEPRPVAPPQPPATGVAASAAPGPATGIPGRPGVAPRPGQLGVPGQGYRPGQVQAPPRPGQPIPGRRPAGNGPFRPLTPPGNIGPRPFTPRPATPGSPLTQQSPSPSSGSGGPRGPQPRGRGQDGAAKKDREKEMLLEKERQRKKRSLDGAPTVQSAVLETIEIPDILTVQELATSMITPAKDVIKELIKMGTMATINQNIPATVAQNVARKFGFNAVIKEAGDEVVVEQEEDRPELLSTRPPVVTVLGHVDHGKTSLLDKIRSAEVAAGEAGGITQRIGAYTVERNARKITFIDTPGHAAFTAMRARGAKVTDVAILVVAADDGVMPQTLEAISHIRAANVPIVVAINKMDKEDAQPDRVKSQLSEQGLQPVDWGGKTEMVFVSARTGDGIDQLLETVLLEADIRDLKANKTRRAQGVVIESALDKGRGAVATVLVQNGTLRVGDVVVVGSAFGKIRALVDDKGKQVKKAGPSIPVEIMGLSEVPSAGDTLLVVSDERVAREAAAKRGTRRQEVRIAATSGPRVSLESFMSTPADGGNKTLNLILKADGQGAVEALRGRVEGLSNAEVDIRVIYAGVGAITPNDVNLANASNAVLIGFNIRPDETVKRLAENDQVDLRFYTVIYDVENDLKKALVGMLTPKFREVVLGRAEVREVFKVSKVGTIAGCYVQSGKLTRNAKVRILRDSAVIFESELESLRRFKDDVKEVADGFECGVQIAKFSDLKQGDVIEAFTSELVAPEPMLV
jgi:translation initiation factor IF-2